MMRVLMSEGTTGLTFNHSEQTSIKIHAKLLDSGNAYYCFCSEERLNNLREEQRKKKEAADV